MLRQSRQHARPDFFGVVKREDNIGPAFPGERAMRSTFALHAPPQPQKRCEHAPRFRCRPLTHQA